MQRFHRVSDIVAQRIAQFRLFGKCLEGKEDSSCDPARQKTSRHHANDPSPYQFGFAVYMVEILERGVIQFNLRHMPVTSSMAAYLAVACQTNQICLRLNGPTMLFGFALPPLDSPSYCRKLLPVACAD